MTDEKSRSPNSAIRPRLVVITDVTVAPADALDQRIARALAAARARTVMVQLRDKTLPVPGRLTLGERLAALCRRYEQFFVVNDRLDLAVLLGADGVHLPENGIPVEDARRVLGSDAWISRACHRASDVADSPANAVLLSPIAAERKGRAALGIAALAAARCGMNETSPLLYALGGVDASNAAACLSAGADGVAVIGAVLDGRPVASLLDALRIAK